MRFRWTLLLTLAALSIAADVKPGSPVSRWSIKTSLPQGADLSKPGRSMPLADLLAFPAAADRRTKEFQDKRYPRADGATVGEGDIVRTKGWIRLIAGEDDGDFHVQITQALDSFDNCLIVEVPRDDVKFIGGSPEVMAAAKTVREFLVSKILNGADPTGRVMVIGKAYVEVGGQLFFDSEHQAGMASGNYRGKAIKGKPLPSKTSWEIHPVTAIAFAPRPE